MLNHTGRLLSGILVFLFLIAGAAGIYLYPYYKAIQPALPDKKAPLIPFQENESMFTVHQDFSFHLFSDEVVNPRVMIEDEQGNILISEPSASRVSLINDDQTRLTLVDGLNRPHGLALKEKTLFIAETGQVIAYTYENQTVSNPVVLLDLPADGRHWTRTLGIGPDGMLYISIGSSCNICIESDWRRDKILRYDLENEVLDEYAIGLRNSVFFAWHPVTNELFATEMGRDWLGDDLPPDELNLIVEGGDYGFPYCYGKQIVDPEYNDEDYCEESKPSFYDFGAHESPLGIDFFEEDAIIALHGSWNRKDPIGYEVIRLTANSDYQERETLLSGFLTEDGDSIGRPAGILVTAKNEILISDDKANRIYRLSPKQE